MLTSRLIPASLEHVVEGLWGSSGDAPANDPPRTVLPTGTVEIIFNFGDPIVHIDVDAGRALPSMYVTGQRTRPVVPVIRGRHDLLVISLYPWSAPSLLPGCSSASDAYAPLSEFIDNGEVAWLEDHLNAARGLTARARIALSFLDTLHATRARVPRDIVRHAAQCLGTSRTHRTVRAVAHDLGLSQRHLARCFGEDIGLSPKTYSRVMRFQSALPALRRGTKSLAAIASAYGYTDQAHMSHDARAFSGMTPQQIGNRRPASRQDVTSRLFHCVYL